MNSKVTVQQNQTLLDIILQEYGTLEAGIQMVIDNDLPISALPATRTFLSISDSIIDKADMQVLTYLRKNGIIIGTKALPDAEDALITEDGSEYLVTEDGTDTLVNEN